jgi:hypothetical protein
MKLQTVVWLTVWVPVLAVVFYRRWMKRDDRSVERRRRSHS